MKLVITVLIAAGIVKVLELAITKNEWALPVIIIMSIGMLAEAFKSNKVNK